jgi:hypothetical protein
MELLDAVMILRNDAKSTPFTPFVAAFEGAELRFNTLSLADHNACGLSQSPNPEGFTKSQISSTENGEKW